MSNNRYRVCVVTLTYSNRWQFLEQVLKRALAADAVVNVVLVDNGSTYPVRGQLFDDRIILLQNVENLGSAGGYQQGIRYAFKEVDCDFIWLLDDDNLPDTNALEELLNHWDTIPGPANRKALFSFRTDRLPHVKIAMGEDPGRYYLVPDNFLGFHLFRIVKNQYLKLLGKFKKTGPFADHVKIPYVPYGGLLLHKELVREIGYPDERFYLYVDDSEYSYRITQRNGAIWLVPASRIVDIDRSQGLTYHKKAFHSHLLDQWSFRTYYHVRNRMFFYSHVSLRNNFIFGINKTLYLTFLQIISILSDKRSAYKKLLGAVKDGLKGNLGKADPGKF
ncbi:glycosyltransferase [Pedobacter sp. HMF7056]|uniref:Glycosyltransferase n=2 Tax=Hufsiella ginkgonis TaxID=2695274 RepID=A0A7K1Y468_9SPHI|nr:glycosyltransferase [Hufsiella ginkgonis]